MTLSEIKKVLNAVCVTEHDDSYLDSIVAETGCGTDLLSDALALNKEKCVLLTGLTNSQVIRTAEVLDSVGVIFVRGKVPTQEVIGLAKAKSIPLLCTNYPMFESCGLLYKTGLGVVSYVR